jgi:hypothetical protein
MDPMNPDDFASLASLVLSEAQVVADLARRVTKSDRQEHRRALHNQACSYLKRAEDHEQQLEFSWKGLAISRDRRYDYAMGATSNAMRFARFEMKLATTFLFQKEIER